MSDNIHKFAQKLISIYALSLDVTNFTGVVDDRISFTDILDMNNVRYTTFDYSYDGNGEKTKVAIAFDKDIFKMSVEKTHKDNNVTWGIL